MPTPTQYLLSYGPLAFTLSTAIIDIALTTNTSDKSRKSQQGAANFYKSLRNYYPATISLASAWSSGYLTYVQLTDGTYKNVTNLFDKVSADPKSVIITSPVLSTGIALGLNGINVAARIFTQAGTNSSSSSTTINANKVFDILGGSVFPQLSGGLLVGTIGGAVAGGVNLLLKDTSVITKPILDGLGVKSSILDTVNSLGTITTKQVDSLKTLINGGQIDSLQKISTANIELISSLTNDQLTALTGIDKDQLTALKGIDKTQLTALKDINTAQLTALKDINTDQLTALKGINTAQLTALKGINTDQLTELSKLTTTQIAKIANI